MSEIPWDWVLSVYRLPVCMDLDCSEGNVLRLPRVSCMRELVHADVCNRGFQGRMKGTFVSGLLILGDVVPVLVPSTEVT